MPLINVIHFEDKMQKCYYFFEEKTLKYRDVIGKTFFVNVISQSFFRATRAMGRSDCREPKIVSN